MAADLVLAALAGVLIPSPRGVQRTAGGPEHAEIVATVAGGA